MNASSRVNHLELIIKKKITWVFRILDFLRSTPRAGVHVGGQVDDGAVLGGTAIHGDNVSIPVTFLLAPRDRAV